MAAPGADISQLSESQQLALQQYTAVTDQDVASAIPLLQRSQWNVEIAITKFFDGEGPDLVAEALAAQNAPPIRNTRQENLQESLLYNAAARTRSPPQDLAPRIVPQPDQLTRRPPLLLSILFSPFTLLYKLLSGTFSLFTYIFPFLPLAFQPRQPNTRARPSTNRRPLKPRDAVARLKREFEEDYGENALPFFEGGYAQALDVAKADLKFLLIVLLSPEHDDTASFIRDTLLSPLLLPYISNTSKILFWVGDVRDAEAYEVSNALHCTKFPFTAVVAPDTKVSSTSMVVVERIVGPMDAGTYLARLTAAVNSHDVQLAELRASRSAQDYDRNIRQAQDSAYERSLAADRERARLKKEAEIEAAAAAKREKEATEAKEKLARDKLQWRRWRASKISTEPSVEEKDVVRIGLKLPEAARVMRRFKSSDSLEEVYAYVECYDLLEDVGGVEGREYIKPKGYEHVYGFRLVQTFPRVVYAVEEGGTVGERVGRGGNLIVEPILGDDEEEDEE